MTLACVVNVSEGRRAEVIASLAAAAGSDLLDLHTDPDHNRAVLTVVGERAPRAVATEAVGRLDIATHEGVHPRIGVVDVVPFVPVQGDDLGGAVRARDEFAVWLGAELGVPCFVYGPERSLPDVRREAFRGLAPDAGPANLHPSAGACAVGARLPLVAYNLWLASHDLDLARSLARSLRGPAVRALGLPVGDQVQVSLNLVDPDTVGPAAVFDQVAASVPIDRAELVGLIPKRVLRGIPEARWAELDLSADRTIESRLASHLS